MDGMREANSFECMRRKQIGAAIRRWCSVQCSFSKYNRCMYHILKLSFILKIKKQKVPECTKIVVSMILLN